MVLAQEQRKIMTKEEMELEKLSIELSILKKPWYLKPSVLVSVCSLLFAVYQYQDAERKSIVAENKTVIAEQKKVEAEEVIKDNEIKADYLSVKESKVTAVEKQLMSSEQLSTTEKQLTPSELPPVVDTDYIIDVWAYGVDESVVQSIRLHLIAKGNNVGFGGLLNYHPKWLATESTVLYYDKGSKVIAEAFADDLKELTNISFKVKWGAGLGVDKEEKDRTFFVHVVN